MWLKPRGTDLAGEPGYGADTLRKVAALATRLQSRRQETLTAREMEVIGAEVGLDRAFIRQALAQLAAERPRAELEEARRREFWSLALAFIIPLFWGTLAISSQRSVELMTFFSLVAPGPLAALLGFLAGRRGAGFASGVALVLSCAPTVALLGGLSPGVAFPYLAFGIPFAGWLGWQGAKIRDHYFPLPTARLPVSRPALLSLLFSLQRQLEGQRQHRAFLSVDVVGSSEMKRGGPELAVEHSFGQYRSWVEDVVSAHGGEMQSAAGDGVMAIFPTDVSAVRTAHHLQEELACFNQTHNRLPLPFRIRCGVSAGEVALEEGTPLGHLQSPVIDRAAALQKRAEPGDIVVSPEVAGAALTELGGVAALAEPVGGETAFSWQAARRPGAALP